LASRSREVGFRLVRYDEYLSPNRARNIGAALASTEYVVFVDNDAIVLDGWLPPLVERADTTGAWVVGPLYLIGEPEYEAIHAAGGNLTLEGPASARRLTTEHCLQGTRISELAEPLEARRCDFAEFHCMLVRAEALERVGPFDEALLSTREHEDFCLAVRDRGGEVWFEPASVVTYLPPPRRPRTNHVFGPPLRPSDVPFYALRWSELWNTRSIDYFVGKHGLEPEYRSRVGIMNAQRQSLLTPVRSATRRVFGSRVETALAHYLYRAERVVNRAVFR
jgi:cellulose synthase/poly-beta-1,6-N-acetylglucosamine synthase-like glycosyltransferase